MRRARNDELRRHPELRIQAEQRAREERLQARWKPEDRGGRQRMKLAVAQHEGRARKLGRNKAIAETKLVAERHGSRLLYQQRIRSRIDEKLADPLGHDDAAGPLLALENDDRTLTLAELE